MASETVTVPDDRPARVAPGLAILATTALAVAILRWQGRRLWCACGSFVPWSFDARGPHNSQHLADPYSLSHGLHGLIFYGALRWAAPGLAIRWRLAIAVAIECAWEVAENSAFVIDRYRDGTAAQGYTGDSLVNSIGDILSCIVGFEVARRLSWRWSLALFAAVELVMLLAIRDNLTLNVLMLLYPLESIRAWQGK